MNRSAMAMNGNKLERFDVLDALRFILAMWVVIAHVGAFPIMGAHPSPGLEHVIARFTNALVWGIPAVMAFFVISGFCIHYALAGGREFRPSRFYMRRYTRILIPAFVIVLVIFATQNNVQLTGKESVLFRGTLWSLLCEEAYYAAYPLIRVMRRRVGWMPILGVSMAVSVTLSSTYYRHAQDFFDVGPLGTIVILFPVWLLGCVLAEQMAAGHFIKVNRAGIWAWRSVAYAAMWIAEALNFHSSLSQVHTLLFVGIVMYFWLRAELCYARGKRTHPWLMKAGAFSYSLYLVHPPLFAFIETHVPTLNAITVLGWCVQVMLAIVLSYIFYVFIEGPAHVLAKNLSRVRAHMLAIARLG